MSQASLPTPKSSECSSSSAVGLQPDQEHSTALKASHCSCSTLKGRRHVPVQRNVIEATCSIERTPNNKSDLDGRCKELQTLWDGRFSNGSSANMHWFVRYLQPARNSVCPLSRTMSDFPEAEHVCQIAHFAGAQADARSGGAIICDAAGATRHA
jgi:hypothetical protein